MQASDSCSPPGCSQATGCCATFRLLRPSGYTQTSSRRRDRLRPARERIPRRLRQNHRSGPEAAAGNAGTRPRSRPKQARPLTPPDPRPLHISAQKRNQVHRHQHPPTEKPPNLQRGENHASFQPPRAKSLIQIDALFHPECRATATGPREASAALTAARDLSPRVPMAYEPIRRVCTARREDSHEPSIVERTNRLLP